MGPLEFQEPSDLEEAESRREQLLLDVSKIQAQLGSRNRTDTQGRRLRSEKYSEWRTRASHSLATKNDELRRINRWIRGRKKELFEERMHHIHAHDALTLVKRMHKLITSLKSEGIEFSLDEEEEIQQAEEFLRKADSENKNDA